MSSVRTSSDGAMHMVRNASGKCSQQFQAPDNSRVLGHGLITAQPQSNGGEFDHGEIVGGTLFIARGDASEMTDFVEEELDEVALFVELDIEGRRRAPVGLGRNMVWPIAA